MMLSPRVATGQMAYHLSHARVEDRCDQHVVYRRRLLLHP